LADALPGFTRFATGRPPSDQIRQQLISLARLIQSREPAPFYSMPDVASYFGVSVTTVARLYRQLERDGWLLRKRGSMTVVPPRSRRARARIRGVIAVPIWSPGFLLFYDWRVFFRRLEDAVRRYRYVADPIFFRQNEEAQPSFVERVLDHEPDFLLWFCPDVATLPIIQSIGGAAIKPCAFLVNLSFMAAVLVRDSRSTTPHRNRPAAKSECRPCARLGHTRRGRGWFRRPGGPAHCSRPVRLRAPSPPARSGRRRD
jgi:hypothetical protein